MVMPDGVLNLTTTADCRVRIDMNLRILTLSLVALSIPTGALKAQGGRTPGVELDVPFVDGGGHEQQLDLYTPSGSNYPTILFIHEGSLTSGDRKDDPYPKMCQTFQTEGVGFAAANYRLAPKNKWPAPPNDVVAALRWLKDNIGERGGDPDRLFLFGHSSGCLLVSIVATDSTYLEAQGLRRADIAGVISMGRRLNDHVEVTDAPPLHYEASWVPPDHVDDIMSEDPVFVSLEQRNAAVPASHLSARLPPTLILIAEEERFFPPILRDAAEFAGRALVAGADDVDLHVLRDRRHMTAIQMMVTADDPAVVKILEFVRSH